MKELLREIDWGAVALGTFVVAMIIGLSVLIWFIPRHGCDANCDEYKCGQVETVTPEGKKAFINECWCARPKGSKR